MIPYFYVDIDWKSCKKDCTEEVGVEVHNLIVDVLQAIQRLPKWSRCWSISKEDEIIILLPAGKVIPLQE